MRALPAVLLAGLLVFPPATASDGNKGGAGGSSHAVDSQHGSIDDIRNTNGQWSADRDSGLERAQERRSDSALEHSNALVPHPEQSRGAGKVSGRR